jgi:protein N-lysine methyltransferase METTL21D
MADVTYNTASFGSLLRTVEALLRRPRREAKDGQACVSPLVLLGYKERDAGERDLWRMAGEKGISFDLVAKVSGADEPAVEIWVGRADLG